MAEGQSCSIYSNAIALDVHALPQLDTPNRVSLFQTQMCGDTHTHVLFFSGNGNSAPEIGARRKEGFVRERESVWWAEQIL